MDADVIAPRVDIIVPTHNRPELTEDAVTSVKAQTFPDWRILIVDDASDAESRRRLRFLTEGEPRILLIERTACGGPQVARHDGYLASTAPFVAFLDSDDLWLPEKLAKQIAYFESNDPNEQIGGVVCQHQWVDLR
jgi:teichuronic acid biosynthesis glycosyltransferase TuaG